MKAAEPIAFTKDETRDMVRRLQTYFETELDQDLGGLPAEMLLAFIARDLGPTFYNRGLRDAQVVVAGKAEDAVDALYAMEQPPGAN